MLLRGILGVQIKGHYGLGLGDYIGEHYRAY